MSSRSYAFEGRRLSFLLFRSNSLSLIACRLPACCVSALQQGNICKLNAECAARQFASTPSCPQVLLLQFFITPTISQDGVEREVKAVDSE